MFSLASVSHGYVGGGVGTHVPDTWNLGYYRVRLTSGQCASYWYAFLFLSQLMGCMEFSCKFSHGVIVKAILYRN